jgi:hypothetical protein
MNETFTTSPTSGRLNYSGSFAVGTSVAVIIPKSAGRQIGISLLPTGTARVEYTLSPESFIAAGTATWQPWAKGDVASYADDVMLIPATAVRCVVTSAAATLQMVL